jgi:hypothetical protein
MNRSILVLTVYFFPAACVLLPGPLLWLIKKQKKLNRRSVLYVQLLWIGKNRSYMEHYCAGNDSNHARAKQ